MYVTSENQYRIVALKEQEIQNFIMQFIHHGSLTSASICHDYCYTTALHVMESLHMESYVHKGTATIFSSGQVVQGAKKWLIVWFLVLFSRKLPHAHKFLLFFLILRTCISENLLHQVVSRIVTLLWKKEWPSNIPVISIMLMVVGGVALY